MSFCAVNMQKYKMNAVGGMQSHNRRENYSTKNREINDSFSHLNYDLIDPEDRSYAAMIKERISALNLKKAPRHDAVTYCSFIVSSDQGFFMRLGEKEHIFRENEYDEMVAHGFREPDDFEFVPPEYQRECIRDGSRPFFEDAVRFFKRRYGAENVINGTVHVDEIGAIHMHVGIVPVTPDGRLSAKKLFTPASLRELQTAFAEEVGAKYGLERGKEGSEATHLDEISYKLAIRQEQLDEVEQELEETLQAVEDARNDLKDLRAERDDLNANLSKIEAEIEDQREELAVIEAAIKKKDDEGERYFGDRWKSQKDNIRADREKEKRLSLLEKFIQLPHIKPFWEAFINPRFREKKRSRSQHNIGD